MIVTLLFSGVVSFGQNTDLSQGVPPRKQVGFINVDHTEKTLLKNLDQHGQLVDLKTGELISNNEIFLQKGQELLLVTAVEGDSDYYLTRHFINHNDCQPSFLTRASYDWNDFKASFGWHDFWATGYHGPSFLFTADSVGSEKVKVYFPYFYYGIDPSGAHCVSSLYPQALEGEVTITVLE